VQPRRAKNTEQEAQEPPNKTTRAQKEPTGATRNTKPKHPEPGAPNPRAPKRPNPEPPTAPTTEAKENQGQWNRKRPKGHPGSTKGANPE